jgi:hypothetical protein
LMFRAREAYLIVLSVSAILYSTGDTQAIMVVRALPPIESGRQLCQARTCCLELTLQHARELRVAVRNMALGLDRVRHCLSALLSPPEKYYTHKQK